MMTTGTSYTCDLCSLSVNSPEQLQQHFQGKAHIKKLRTTELINFSEAGGVLSESDAPQKGKKRKLEDAAEGGVCTVCNAVFNSPLQAHQHYSGSKHVKKVKAQEVIKTDGDIVMEIAEKGDSQGKVDTPGKTVAPGKVKAHANLFCGFCNIQVNSQDQLDIHREGTKHKKNLMKAQKSPASYIKNTPKPTNDVPSSLPLFESYLSTSFVSAESAIQTTQS